MAVDGAELTNVWVRLRTALALGLGRARLVDIWSPADRAIGVGGGVGVFTCEAGPSRVDVWLVELRRLDVRLGCVLGDGQATLEEGRIDVGILEIDTSGKERSERSATRTDQTGAEGLLYFGLCASRKKELSFEEL